SKRTTVQWQAARIIPARLRPAATSLEGDLGCGPDLGEARTQALFVVGHDVGGAGATDQVDDPPDHRLAVVRRIFGEGEHPPAARRSPAARPWRHLTAPRPRS